MNHARRPRPAAQSTPIPTLDRLAAGLALGSLALSGCDNPFCSSELRAQTRADPLAEAVHAAAALRAETPPPPTVTTVASHPPTVPHHWSHVMGRMPMVRPHVSPPHHSATTTAQRPHRTRVY